MRFNDWHQQIEDLHKRTQPLVVEEEMLTADVPGENITIFLAQAGIKFLDETGNSVSISRYYVPGNKSWQYALGDLRTKVELAEGLNEKLIKSFVAPYLKEAVLDRMTGAEDLPDNEVILKMAAAKRERQLLETLPKKDNTGAFSGIFPLPSPSKVHPLQVQYDASDVQLFYGGYQRKDSGTKNNVSFLRNYDEISRTIKEFAKAIGPVVRLAKKAR